MKSKQTYTTKFLEDVIEDIKNDQIYSAKDNVRIATAYIDSIIYG